MTGGPGSLIVSCPDDRVVMGMFDLRSAGAVRRLSDPPRVPVLVGPGSIVNDFGGSFWKPCPVGHRRSQVDRCSWQSAPTMPATVRDAASLPASGSIALFAP